MTNISLKTIIAPAFYDLHRDIKQGLHTHYWLKGGRGSTKSSFISVEIPTGFLKDSNANAIILRKYGVSLEKSVYNQILWALDKLQLSAYWKAYKSPLRLVYTPTGQEIVFLGMDDPQKIKSLKPAHGYYKYVWFEEVSEADGIEEIRSIIQSVVRGGEEFRIFYSFNPPANQSNWVNQEVAIPRDDKIVHHSTYLDVPPEWLGKQFFIEAEHLKETNELAYRHEYLGEATGTGLTVFPNVKLQEITDEQIQSFDNIKQGIDWGYAADPFTYVKSQYSQKYKRLYIFDEIYAHGLLNSDAIEQVNEKRISYQDIIADSEDPKSIAEFWDAGIYIRGAKKGPGSRGFGFRFLQGMEEIIIDPQRCPNAAREFSTAEFEKEKDGTVRNEYPDKDDHTIDAVRYSLEDDMPIAMKVR